MSMADVLKIIEQGANIQLAFTTLISFFFFFNFFRVFRHPPILEQKYL